MPSLEQEAEALIRGWRAVIAKNPPAGQSSRETGFTSALTVCADQLQEALDRSRGDA